MPPPKTLPKSGSKRRRPRRSPSAASIQVVSMPVPVSLPISAMSLEHINIKSDQHQRMNPQDSDSDNACGFGDNWKWENIFMNERRLLIICCWNLFYVLQNSSKLYTEDNKNSFYTRAMTRVERINFTFLSIINLGGLDKDIKSFCYSSYSYVNVSIFVCGLVWIDYFSICWWHNLSLVCCTIFWTWRHHVWLCDVYFS
jgi:hypothetical protein